jgi:hypothetical protein
MIEGLEQHWRNYEKQIVELLNFQFELYYDSECYQSLKTLCQNVRKSLDFRFNDNSSFDIKVSIPFVKPVALVRRAILSQNFRQDYLYSLTPLMDGTFEQAKLMEEILNANLVSTNFRATTFSRIKDSLASYGTAVVYTCWQEKQSQALQTQYSQLGFSRQPNVKRKANAYNQYIHVLDYGQDPTIADSDKSSYQFHIDRKKIYEILADAKRNFNQYNPDAIEYLKKLAVAQSSELSDKHHTGAGLVTSDMNPRSYMGFVDIVKMYTVLPIPGNEDDDTVYYVEFLTGGKILRFIRNPNDNDNQMFSILTYYKKEEFWWGNADCQFQLSHENLTGIIETLRINNAIQSMRDWIIGVEGVIDVNEMQSHRFITANPRIDQKLRDSLIHYQPVDNSSRTTEEASAVIRENAQKFDPVPDFSRDPTKGGLNNKTATAANMIQASNNVKEADIMEEVAFGLIRMAQNNIEMLQQRLDMQFAFRSTQLGGMVQVPKEVILGQYTKQIQTSLTESKRVRIMDLWNTLTSYMNAASSGHPSFQQFNFVAPILKEIAKNLENINIDEVMASVQNPVGNQFQTEMQPQPEQGAMPVQGGINGQAIPQTA